MIKNREISNLALKVICFGLQCFVVGQEDLSHPLCRQESKLPFQVDHKNSWKLPDLDFFTGFSSLLTLWTKPNKKININ